MDRERRPIKGTVAESECMKNAQIVHDAKASGKGYSKSFKTLDEDIMPIDIQADDNRYTNTVSNLWEFMGYLRESEVISDLAPDEIDSFNDTESSWPVYVAPSIGDRMDCSLA